MSNSWGHAAGTLHPRQIPHEYVDWTDKSKGTVPYRCSSRGCNEPVTHWTSYRYVTGRAGRVSSATKKTCLAHAERFATKYGIEVTQAPAVPTESQAMVSQFLGGPGSGP